MSDRFYDSMSDELKQGSNRYNFFVTSAEECTAKSLAERKANEESSKNAAPAFDSYADMKAWVASQINNKKG